MIRERENLGEVWRGTEMAEDKVILGGYLTKTS